MNFRAVLLIAAIGLAGPAHAQAPAAAPEVDVARPLVQTIVDYDIYTGRFEAVREVDIRPRVSGYLDKVLFEDGNIVNKGDLLFEIDPRPFEALRARAQAALTSAKATRDLAALELRRAQTLAQRNFGTEQDVDRTAATLAEAAAQVDFAQAELRQAELDLSFTRIHAPFHGRLSDSKLDPGNLIIGGTASSDILTTLVSIDPIHFIFTTSEADYLRYARLAPMEAMSNRTERDHNPIKVQIRLMDETEFEHAGTLDFVDNTLDPNSGTIALRAVLPNAEGFLIPGSFGRIKLPTSNAYEAMLIPPGAVLSDQARKIIMVVDKEGIVGIKPVVLGPLYQGLQVIRQGLDPDDQVIINGLQRAHPGSKVTPQLSVLKLDAKPQ